MNIIRIQSHSLLPGQTSIIARYIQPTSTAVGAAVVRLYFAQVTKPWVYSKIQGVLLFVIDRVAQTNLLRIIDPNNPLQIMFQTQTYVNFEQYYVETSQHFSYFPIKGGFAGFFFAKPMDNNLFKSLIETYCVKCRPQKLQELKESYQKQRKVLQQIESFKSSDPKRRETISDSLPNTPMAGKGFSLSQVIQSIGNGSLLQDPSLAPIGRPIQFQQVNNAWWDSTKQQINFKRLPQEIKQIFKRSNVKKKDLKNDIKTTMQVFEVIMNYELQNLSKGQNIKLDLSSKNSKQDKSSNQMFNRINIQKSVREQKRIKAKFQNKDASSNQLLKSALQNQKQRQMDELQAGSVGRNPTLSISGQNLDAIRRSHASTKILSIQPGGPASAIPTTFGTSSILLPPPPPPPGRMMTSGLSSQANLGGGASGGAVGGSGIGLSMQQQLQQGLRNLKKVDRNQLMQKKEEKRLSDGGAIAVSSRLAHVIAERKKALQQKEDDDDFDDDDDDSDDDY